MTFYGHCCVCDIARISDVYVVVSVYCLIHNIVFVLLHICMCNAACLLPKNKILFACVALYV